MNTTHCAKACDLLLSAALLTGLGFIPYATAQIYLIDINFQIATELGSFRGSPLPLARALNHSGEVAGVSVFLRRPTFEPALSLPAPTVRA